MEDYKDDILRIKSVTKNVQKSSKVWTSPEEKNRSLNCNIYSTKYDINMIF